MKNILKTAVESGYKGDIENLIKQALVGDQLAGPDGIKGDDPVTTDIDESIDDMPYFTLDKEGNPTEEINPKIDWKNMGYHLYDDYFKESMFNLDDYDKKHGGKATQGTETEDIEKWYQKVIDKK